MPGRVESAARTIAFRLWLAAFVVGAMTHALELGGRGWLPYRFAPDALNLFWSMLTFVDPLVVALLVWRRNLGVALGLTVMVLDIAANAYATYGLGHPELAFPLHLQGMFFGFALGSAGLLWRDRN